MRKLLKNKKACCVLLLVIAACNVLLLGIGMKNSSAKKFPQQPFVFSPISPEKSSIVTKYFRWPQAKPFIQDSDVTNPFHTSFSMLHPADKHKKGDRIAVKITARNGRGEMKTFGGDYFRVLLTSNDLLNGVTGDVIDHENGSYTVYVPLPFDGEGHLKVILIHPSESVQVLRKVTSSKGSPGLIFSGLFDDGKWQERAECNVWLHTMEGATEPELRANYCNFSHATMGEPWICEKPSQVPCSFIKTYEVARTYDAADILRESGLFRKGVNLRVMVGQPIKLEIFPSHATNQKLAPCRLPEVDSLPPRPGGYFFKDEWNSFHCRARHFATSQDEASCLEGKTIYFLGDSTIRQWYSYYVPLGLPSLIPKLKSGLSSFLGLKPGVAIWEKGPVTNLWEPRQATDPINNITLHFSAHGPPLQNGGSPYTMPYIADRLDGVKGGAGTAVVVTIGPHLLLFHPSVFITRLRGILRAMRRLLERAPSTQIFFKGFNVYKMDDLGSNQCCLFDWLAYRLDSIARRMIGDTQGVIYLDAWDMSASHHSTPNGLHTQAHVVRNELQLFLSFLCPK
ncbi:unnamed protein product [Clavelina lepadiformis]|uniref:NXPE C-terminal domain-containing protein n=1 Tax=Clavelina lepadiformis TaxID=159417 RepID=A0ABP0GQ55_CLALP